MNTIGLYTPLESLLLFQSLLSHGIESTAFRHISDQLKDNRAIKKGATYDANRLTPESLQELFLHLLREELRSEADGHDKPEPSLSPNSRKRKLQSPPLPSLSEARNHLAKLPVLVDRLYARYRDHVIREVREDEQRLDSLQGEIRDIERRDVEAEKPSEPPSRPAPNGTLTPGVVEPIASPTVPVPTKATNGDPKPPHPAVQPQEPSRGVPRPEQATATKAEEETGKAVSDVLSAPISPLAPPQTSPALPGQPTQAGPSLGARGPEAVKPRNGAAQVLQAPQGVASFAPPQGPAPHYPASQKPAEGLQRPEGIARPKAPAGPPSATPPVSGQLKWEPPYQPNQPHVPPQHQQPHISAPHSAPGLPQQGSPLPQWNPQASLSYPSPRPPPTSHAAPPQGQSAQQPIPPPAPHAGSPQYPVPRQQAVPARASSESSPVPPPGKSPSAAPPPTLPERQTQTPSSQQQQPPRPSFPPPPTLPRAAASPPPRPASTQQRPPQPPPTTQPVPQTQPPASSPSPAPPAVSKAYDSPYNLPPRLAIPDHVLEQQHASPVAATPTPASRISPATQPSQPPQTPIATGPSFRTSLGSGTRWKVSSTPSTPHPSVGGAAEPPPYEPLSPVLPPAALPTLQPPPQPKKGTQKAAKENAAPTGRPRGRPRRGTQRGADATAAPAATAAVPTVGSPPGASQSRASTTEGAPRSPIEPGSATIKNEVTTPLALTTEAGDTTADEGGPGRRRTSRLAKRKRRESSSAAVEEENRPREPPAPPTHVLWTRSFNKVSHSAMEQIIGHRSANMFASQIRERDAPGYRGIVLQPQDLKSIRAAISHGNKAATAAAAALPGGDPGTSSVWLPIGVELVPPRGIINSAQLDRELAHMFSNAIMYNPDPDRGPGPGFMRDLPEDEDDGGEGGAMADAVLGYKVDENGVVKDARSMSVEVQKLINDLRSAEIQRGAPPAPVPALGPALLTTAAHTPATGGTSTRQASVAAAGLGETPAAGKDRPGSATEDAEEQSGMTEPESVGGSIAKRRRITRG